MKDFRIDEKGKFFTNHVSKRTALVVAATSGFILRGAMHLLLDNRPKDELNSAERFIAFTDAEVLALDGKTRLYAAPVIVLNKDQIVWLIPQESQDDNNGSDH